MRKKPVIIGGLTFVAVTVALLWPTPGYDLGKVHPKLRELSTPYQRVSTFYGKDGSIGITIVDRDGHKLDLGLPASSDDGPKYQRIHFGPSDGGALTDDTRRMLIRALGEHGSSADGTGSALVSLRGSPRDYLRKTIHFFFH